MTMQSPDIFARFKRQWQEKETQQPARLSPWRCHFLGDTFYIREGHVPNRFHRFMQWLLFGAEWKKR